MSDKKASNQIQHAVDERVDGAKNQDVNKNANDAGNDASKNVQKTANEIAGVCFILFLSPTDECSLGKVLVACSNRRSNVLVTVN
jgi:hypothetical protein